MQKSNKVNNAVNYAHFKSHKCSGLALICKTEIVLANAFLETISIRSNKHLLAPVKIIELFVLSTIACNVAATPSEFRVI